MFCAEACRSRPTGVFSLILTHKFVYVLTSLLQFLLSQRAGTIGNMHASKYADH
jgi:hypothetical protein